ncbi:hypothetical protein BC938DRAFT_475671, partial [Jimgerdemannia flammicorona]
MSDRSRRKRKERPTIASNIHYVGYVEDEESVEAIMKKFEELERIQKEIASSTPASSARRNSSENKENEPTTHNVHEDRDESKSSAVPLPASSPDSQGFTEAQLEEVFRRTSAFTVKSAVMDEVYVDELDELELWQQDGNMDEFVEEDDYIAVDDDFWEMEFGDSPRCTKRTRRPGKAVHTGGVRRAGTDRESIIARYRITQVRLQDAKGNYFIVKKKVSTLDPSLPTYVKIPPVPIPRSWVHTIFPLEAAEKAVPGSRWSS